MALADGLIGAYGSSFSSPPRTTGIESSSSPTSSRAIRVFACPRSPRNTRSWPARIAFSTDGRTVSLKPRTPGKMGRPSPRRAMRFERSSSLTVRPRQPDSRSSRRVDGSGVDCWVTGSSIRVRRDGGGGAVAVERGADGIDGGDAGTGEAGEVIATPLELRLEVAGAPARPFGELRYHAPREMLELVLVGVPCRENRGTQALDVPVLIARDGSDVVRGGNPAHGPRIRVAGRGREGTNDDDDADSRQLVVRQRDRRPMQCVEDLFERVGVDRCREAVPDGDGADRDARGVAPRVRRKVIRKLRRDEDARRRVGGGLTWRVPRDNGLAPPPELARMRKPVERFGDAGKLDAARRRRQEVEQRVEERRLAGPAALGGDDKRHAGFEEEPEEATQLGVERAGPDQLDDRARFRRDRVEAPPAPRWRGDVHGDSDRSELDGWLGDGSVRRGRGSVKRVHDRHLRPRRISCPPCSRRRPSSSRSATCRSRSGDSARSTRTS